MVKWFKLPPKAAVLVGKVISDKTPNMAIVAVPRLVFHKRYRFWRSVQTKCYAHDEGRVARLGDVVRIRKAPVRISTLKKYLVEEVVRKEPSRAFLEQYLDKRLGAAAETADKAGIGRGFAASS